MNLRSRTSAGLLLFRERDGLEVFIAHPGGPLFTHNEDGCWSIPKGEVHPGEDLLATALREFHEETGHQIDPGSEFIPLGSIQQKGGKIVHAWAVRGELEPGFVVHSNLFSMEWPPGSGTMREFPEVDRAEFFSSGRARLKIKAAQIPLIERLEEHLRAR